MSETILYRNLGLLLPFCISDYVFPRFAKSIQFRPIPMKHIETVVIAIFNRSSYDIIAILVMVCAAYTWTCVCATSTSGHGLDFVIVHGKSKTLVVFGLTF